MADNKTINEQFGEQLSLIREIEGLKKRLEKEKLMSDGLSAKLEDAQKQMAGLRTALQESEEKRREAEQKTEQVRADDGTVKKKGKGSMIWKLFKLVFVLLLFAAIIYYYEDELDLAESRNERLWDEREEYRGKAEFMDDYVVIITDDIYHKYGCEELELDRFAVRNTAAVEDSSWYTPCPVCIGEE